MTKHCTTRKRKSIKLNYCAYKNKTCYITSLRCYRISSNVDSCANERNSINNEHNVANWTYTRRNSNWMNVDKLACKDRVETLQTHKSMIYFTTPAYCQSMWIKDKAIVVQLKLLNVILFSDMHIVADCLFDLLGLRRDSSFLHTCLILQQIYAWHC